MWIIPVIVIALIVIGAILLVVPRLLTPPEPTPTPTSAGPCLVTITTEQLVYTRPEAIPDYIFDEAQANYQLVPTGRLANNTWWQTNYNSSWIETTAFGNTAEVSGDCTNLPIVFAPP